MNEEAKAAMSAMNSATARLMNHKPSMGSQVEAEYGAAYQRLVRLGLARQLRGKYRG